MQNSTRSNICLFFSRKLTVGPHQEFYGMSTTVCNTIPWVISTLLIDKAVELSTAKVYVLSDSVLCLGGIHDQWRLGKTKFSGPRSRDLRSIGNRTVSMESQSWSSGKYCPRAHTHCSFFKKSELGGGKQHAARRIQNMESSSRRCTTTSNLEQRKQKFVRRVLPVVAAYAAKVPKGHRSLLGPGSEDTFYGALAHKKKRFVEHCY